MDWSLQTHGSHWTKWFFGWCGIWGLCVLAWLPANVRGQALPAPNPDIASRGDVLQSLVRQLELGQPATRVAAAKSLARLGPGATGATEVLIRHLHDRDSDVRLTVAYALGCIPAEPLPVLRALEPLLSDTDEHVRYSAQWSSARLAAAIESPTDPTEQRALVAVLQQIAQRMAEREHQSRHLTAIQATLARLQPPADGRSVASEPVKEQSQVIQTTAVADYQTLARSIYAASDLTSRYQIVDQVDQLPDPLALRKLIIACEKQQADGAVLQYALSQWGAEGMACLADEIKLLPSNQKLRAEDARLIALFTPQASADWQKLLNWALQTEQTVDGRVACLHALSRAPLDVNAIERLGQALSQQAEDWEVRLAIADTLAGLGKRAAISESKLIGLLQASDDASLRSALARALIQVAPDSPRAAKALQQVLHATALEDPFFCELVEHCRPLGSRCQLNLPEYVAGLQHQDVGVRLTCAKALGSLGPAASASAPLLIERIVDRDESIIVKDAAAQSLAHLGAIGARQLMHELRQTDPAVREHVLRALAITCPTEVELCQRCLDELGNPLSPLQVRVAAAATLGSMGTAASAAVSELLKLCELSTDTSLRAACLLAAARIQPSTAQTVIGRYLEDKHLLMRASAAFACHLCGDSRGAYDGLVKLLNGSTTDQVIASALLDIGPTAEPWLLETACDTSADAEQRLICFRLATERASPNWQRLLSLIDDSDLGEQFAYCVEGNLQTESEVTACVLNLMRETQLSPLTRVRLARLLQPQSLGLGGETNDDWSGFTLSQPIAVGLLRAADQPMAAVGLQQEAEQYESSAAKAVAPKPASSAAASLEDRLPMAPATVNSAMETEAAHARDLAVAGPDEELGRPRVVEVFYGTNRIQLLQRAGLPSLAVGLLATVAGALLTLCFCLFAFWRCGHRSLATLSFIAIGAVASLGYRTAKEVQLAEQSQRIAYGGQYQSDVELGKCEVSIPPNHQIGMLESPNLFKLEIKPDPEKHLMLTKVEPLGRDAFYSSLQSTMGDKGKNILVFIHGYNVSFEDAARRTAQMAHDLEFPGAPVFYSWPSQANWYHYSTDRLNIKQSVPQIRQFLLDLAERSGADTINLIAHSMGNVGLTEALQSMESRSSQPLFHQLVLAAPDIDAKVFKQQIAPSIISKAAHVTLYTSQTDLALIASRYFNHGARVGDSATGVPVFAGIDTIDATAVDSSLLGHTYYGSNVSVLMDLGYLLRNQPISSRNYLRKVVNATQPYWAFDNTRLSQGPGSNANR